MIEGLSDAELVEMLRGGDKAAFTELLQRYSEKAHHLAVRITRDQEDAEEILQDVFLTVFNKINLFEGKSAFSSWLYRITVNTAFMKLRKRKQQAAQSLDDVTQTIQETWVGTGSDSCDIGYISTRHELRSALEDAIERLPDDYRAIFVLRDVDGLSNHEVGEILNLSVAAVKSRLHRSRLMLRRKLKKFYEDYVNSDAISYGSNPSVKGEIYKEAA